MKQYFIIVPIICSLFFKVHAQSKLLHPVALSPDWSYVNGPVNGITDDEAAQKKFGENSAEYFAWDEKRRRQYQERGTDLFERFPNDPHFKEWFSKTTGEWQPYYWKEPKKDSEKLHGYQLKGTSLVHNYDEQGENRWLSRYIFFRSLYLSDSSLKPDERDDFLKNELTNNIFALSSKICSSTGNTEAVFRSYLPLINEYCKEAADMALENKQETRPIQIAVGQFGTHDSLIAKSLAAVQMLVRDSNYHNNLIKGEAFIKKLQETPVPLKLPSLRAGEDSIDLNNYRGQVVLIDFWNIHCGSCVAHMPKYEHIYEKFKAEGFVLVSVCVIGYDGKDNYEKEKARALELEKKFGLTYPSAELHLDLTLDSADNAPADNDPTWKYFGYPAGGALYLLDQRGLYHSGELSGQWLEFYIRKLLKLPLDETGKEAQSTLNNLKPL